MRRAWMLGLVIAACAHAPPPSIAPTPAPAPQPQPQPQPEPAPEAEASPPPFECPLPALHGHSVCGDGTGPFLQRFFTAVARGEPIDAMMVAHEAPSQVLARAASAHACVLWYDPDVLAFDDPELDVLPYYVSPCDGGPWHQHGRLDLASADFAYRERLATRVLHAWLAAHPDARLSVGHSGLWRLYLVRRADDAIVCLSRAHELLADTTPESARCFRVTPALSRASLFVADAPHAPVLVTLDRRTYRLTDDGLEPARAPARRVWEYEVAGIVAAHPTLRTLVIANADASALPSLDALAQLDPRELGDRCLGGQGDELCCILGDRWHCADISTVRRLGIIDATTLTIGADGLSFESRHGDASSGADHHEEESRTVLHFLRVDDDRLVEAGSLELSEDELLQTWSDDDPPAQRPPSLEGTDDALRWTYAIRAPRCVEYLEVTHTHTTQHGSRSTETDVPIAFSPAPTPLPARFDGHGPPWLRDDDAVLDRRGLWQLGTDAWTRVEACASAE